MYKKLSLLLVFVFTTIIFAWNASSKVGGLYLEYPSFKFSRNSHIEYKGVFDVAFSRIRDSRILSNNDKVRVHKTASAEIYLNAESIVRLADNTEFELIKKDSNHFQIDLLKGQVWANVNNLSLDVKTGPSIARIDNSIVNIKREEGKTTFTGVKYNTKVTLFDENNNYLNHLYIPAFNKITALDSAITPVYSQLKLSKLKKELKMTHQNIAEIKEDSWLAKNLEDDIIFIWKEIDSLWEKYANVRLAQLASTVKNSFTYLTFNEQKNQKDNLQRLQELYANAFYFASLEETERAKSNLNQIDELVLKLDEDHSNLYYESLLGFYGKNQKISFHESGFFVKQELKKDILSFAGEEKMMYEEKFLMDEIANFERYLYEYKLSEAKIILTGIVDFWEKKNTVSPLEKEVLLTHWEVVYYNVLANIENVDEDILNLQLNLEKIELAQMDKNSKDEEALRMLNNRISLWNAFLKIKKYKLAKFVIEENIDELSKHLDQSSHSVQNYLAQLKKDVNTKIAYIEENLHGSAHVKEENYKDYYKKTEAEEEAYAYLSEYERKKQEAEDPGNTVSSLRVKDIADKLAAEGIFVLSTNIKQVSDISDKFTIIEARTSSGNIFSAKYNAKTNAFYEIEFNGEIIKNSIVLEEIDAILSYVPPVVDSNEVEVVENDNKVSVENSLAFDLRRETAMKILQDYKITVEKQRIIQDSEHNLIINFKVDEVSVKLIFDEVTQTAKSIIIEGYGEIEETVALEDLVSDIQKYVEEEKINRKLKEVQLNLEKVNFMFSENKIKEHWDYFAIESIYDPATQILFKGVYDLEENAFIEIDLGELGILDYVKTENVSNEIKDIQVAEKLAKEAEMQALSSGSWETVSSGETVLNQEENHTLDEVYDDGFSEFEDETNQDDYQLELVPNEILVSFYEWTEEEIIHSILESIEGEIINDYLEFYQVKIPETQDNVGVEEAIEILYGFPEIEFAEVSYIEVEENEE